MKLYPIVEGQGEVEAAPVLLRRLVAEAGCLGLGIGTPIRRTQSQFHRREEVQKAVALALAHEDCSAVLLLFDGEDECPKDLAAQVIAWARETSGATPCEVVIAYREFETWFLAAVDSLRGRRGVRDDAVAPPYPEASRDAKGALEKLMRPNRGYKETSDQAAFSAAFDLGLAHRRNRSFRKLVKAVGEVLTQLGHPLPVWPPDGWTAD
jgi:hypothetical protein